MYVAITGDGGTTAAVVSLNTGGPAPTWESVYTFRSVSSVGHIEALTWRGKALFYYAPEDASFNVRCVLSPRVHLTCLHVQLTVMDGTTITEYTSLKVATDIDWSDGGCAAPLRTSALF